jgi:hypothetical protein
MVPLADASRQVDEIWATVAVDLLGPTRRQRWTSLWVGWGSMMMRRLWRPCGLVAVLLLLS